jgi:hypothetical protein
MRPLRWDSKLGYFESEARETMLSPEVEYIERRLRDEGAGRGRERSSAATRPWRDVGVFAPLLFAEGGGSATR